MKVKPGYKQTNVGLIPEDWGVEPLGKRSSFKTGPFGSTLHQSDYVREGIPVINPMHIKNGRITPRSDTSISEEAAQRLNEFRMKPGEIIIGRRGDMGRCATVNDHNKGWICGTGSMLIRPRLDDPNFLTLVLSSPTTIKTIEDASVGSTMTNLNQTTLSRLNIQTPSIEEQRAIATAIGDINALLESLNSLITKKRAIKQATMQQLLSGKIRLPEQNDRWKIQRLGDLATMTSGGTPPSGNPEYYGGNIPWVSISDMTKGGKFISKTNRNLTTLGLKNSSAKIFPKNTVLYSIYASLGECSITNIPTSTSQAILGIQTGKSLLPSFLYHYLNYIKPTIASLGQQGTQNNLNKDMVQDFLIPTPSLEEQEKISKIIDEMDLEIKALDQFEIKNSNLKHILTQELLTGRIRLTQ